MNNNQRIGSTQIKELSISESKLASGAVSTNKIQNLAVTTAKLANECIVESKIYKNAVTNSKLHWNTGLFYSTYDYIVAPVLKFADISLTVRQGKDGYPLMHFKDGVGLANRNYLAKVISVTETPSTTSWECDCTCYGEANEGYFYITYLENHTMPPVHIPAIGGWFDLLWTGYNFSGAIQYLYVSGQTGEYEVQGQQSDITSYVTLNGEAGLITYEKTVYTYTFAVDTDLTSVLDAGDILIFGETEVTVTDVSSTEIEVVSDTPIDDYDSISFIEKRDGTFSLLSQRYVYNNGGYTEQAILDIERAGGVEYARYFKDRDIGHIFSSSVHIGSSALPNLNYKLTVVGQTLLSGNLNMSSTNSIYLNGGVISGASVISAESLMTSKSINGLQLGSHGGDYPGTGTWLVIAKFRLSGAYHFANFIGDYMSDARYIGIRLSFTISMGCEATFGQGLSFCNVMYEGVGWPTPNISDYFRVVVTEDTSSGTTFQVQVYRGMWLSGKWSIKNDTRNGGSLTIYNTATVGDTPITSSCPIYYRNKRFEGNIGIGKNPGSYSLDTIGNINAPGYFRSGTNLDSIYSAIAHNHDSTYLKLIGGTITGNIVCSGNNRNVSTIGTYDSTKTQQIWAMGASYLNSVDGSTFGGLYGLAYKHVNNGTGGNMASGHMVTWCQGGTPTAALGTNIWTSGQFISTVATGTSPLSIASTTLVTNLNADLLDGQHGSYYQPLITNPVTGTGTAGYIPKWTSSSAIGNSVIYDDATRIGIGIATSIEAKLHIASAGSTVPTLRLGALSTGSLSFINYQSGHTYNEIISGPNEHLVLSTSGTGRIGVGILSPNGRLNVTALSNINKMTLGSSTEPGLSITSGDGGSYGIYFGVSSSGHSWMQVGRTDSATSYGLSLQASGGSVSIGTTSTVEILNINNVTTANGFNIALKDYGYIGATGSGQWPSFGFNLKVNTAAASDTPIVANTHGTCGYAGIQAKGYTHGIEFFAANGSVTTGTGITTPVMAIRPTGQLVVNAAQGTAPLSVLSTTAVTNLNADLLDGNHASAFATAVHTHTVTRKITVLGADLPTENTTLTIPDGATYVMGANKLEVYVNGVFMYIGHDYNEYSTTAITFFSKLPAGTKIMYRIEQ